MNFPTITRYNWMCCSIILVFLALSSPEPLQAQENQKERITIQVKNQPIQKVFATTNIKSEAKMMWIIMWMTSGCGAWATMSVW